MGQGARRNVRAFAEHPQGDLRGDIGSRGANGPKKSAWAFYFSSENSTPH